MQRRQLALDQLRALAMLAGVFFHAALAHSPLVQPFFPTADASQAAWLDALLWPLHLVRMPLFFVIAGVFAAQSLARRGMAGLMAERARRLLLPLLVGAPLLYVFMSWQLHHAAQQVAQASPMLIWLRQAGDFTLPVGTGHLWFLYYLMLFFVLLWVARLLLPVSLKARLRALPLRAWLLGLPLLLAPALASVSGPHPAPESLLPQFWALAVYGGFFAFGFLYGTRLAELAEPRHLGPLLATGLAACAFFMLQLEGPVARAGWLLGATSACASSWLTLALLGAAQRGLTGASGPVLRYLSASAYWVYLVHLPVLFALQFAWMDQPWPWALKLPLAIGATLAVSLLSFELFGRRLLQPRAISATV
jgi:glucans biosynthesis protein C